MPYGLIAWGEGQEAEMSRQPLLNLGFWMLAVWFFKLVSAVLGTSKRQDWPALDENDSAFSSNSLFIAGVMVGGKAPGCRGPS